MSSGTKSPCPTMSKSMKVTDTFSSPWSSTKKIEGRARSLFDEDEDEKDSKHDKRPD